MLDVNTLVALGHTLHVHRGRAEQGLKAVTGTAEVLGTCAVTELGFVRVCVQAGIQPDVNTAVVALRQFRASSPIKAELWPDDLGADRWPKQVKKPSDLTDGHRRELARANNATFVTLDGGVPGAMLIP